ncbi:MAG TPA: molybdopterin dinucleotide binding domain-containing protein, partial [Aestuariivirgaceae bacterium]|nr:molybdopterin dinucleotide binding domain-containing protein [Aestuariivirgaceae bacterium]
VDDLPVLPDHWAATEEADARHPFKLATSPARTFLNSTFTETPGSLKREGRPTLFVHPADLQSLAIADGDKVRIGNDRGVVTLHVRAFEAVRRGVVIAESIWPNDAFENGCGINSLTGADQPAPCGGAPFHDSHVWIAAAERPA